MNRIETLKIACVADLHGKLPNVEKCDLLIVAGDVCPHFSGKHGNVKADEFFQRNWLLDTFTPWLKQFPYVIGIAGNHDFGLLDKDFAYSLPWEYLLNEGSIFGKSKGVDLKIWGSPYTPTFFDWAFMLEEEKLELLWEIIPEVDILITHGPPKSILDFSLYQRENCGSKSLLNKVLELKPKYHIFGHIHESRGILVNHTTFINCTQVNHRYQTAHKPYYFEY